MSDFLSHTPLEVERHCPQPSGTAVEPVLQTDIQYVDPAPNCTAQYLLRSRVQRLPLDEPDRVSATNTTVGTAGGRWPRCTAAHGQTARDLCVICGHLVQCARSDRSAASWESVTEYKAFTRVDWMPLVQSGQQRGLRGGATTRSEAATTKAMPGP